MLDDEFFMKRAISLALRAKGRTSPNPLVGAVIVKDKEIIAEGYHHTAGRPHAEIEALDKVAGLCPGATLYVNLEPCSHFGRTPPCVERIVDSGIKKVVVGMLDPNPLNNGKGIKFLRKKGIEVKVGVLKELCENTNQIFIKYITKKMPFVVVKVAQSLDGKIATNTGESKWISSSYSREFSHRERFFYDAVMIGINTLLKDDPSLNPSKRKSTHFYKIVLDSYLRIPLRAKILSSLSEGKLILATGKDLKHKFSKRKIKSLEKKGAILLYITRKEGKINLVELFSKLAKMQISSVFVEGGGRLIGSLFDERLVDKVLFFISPRIIGGAKARTSVEGKGIAKLSKTPLLKNINLRKIKNDLLFEADVFYP